MAWKKITGTVLILVMLTAAGCGLGGNSSQDSPDKNTPAIDPNAAKNGGGKGQQETSGSKALKYVDEIDLLGKGLQLNSLNYSAEGNIFVSPDGKFAALSAANFEPEGEEDAVFHLILVGLTDGSVKVLDTGPFITVLQWSPDGKTILYRKFESLMAVDAGAGKTREIAARSYHGSISPDGTKVAYAETGKGIGVVGLDGTGRKRLTDKPGDWYPLWYPDGKNIFYFADRGVTLGDGAGQLQGFGKVNVETGKREDLIPLEKGKYRRAEWVAKDVLLIDKGWDDGSFGIIANLATSTVSELGENNMYAEYSTAIDRADGLVLKATPDKVSAIDGNGRTVWSFPYKKPVNDSQLSNFGYTVSPDGTTLAYLFGDRGYYADTKIKGRQIWLVGSGGTNLRVLTADYGDYHQPAWTPDGKHLVVVETDGGLGKRFVVKILPVRK